MFTCVNKWENIKTGKREKDTREFNEVGWEEEKAGLFKIRLPASPVVVFSYEKSKRMELMDRENIRQRNGNINKAFASEVS